MSLRRGVACALAIQMFVAPAAAFADPASPVPASTAPAPLPAPVPAPASSTPAPPAGNDRVLLKEGQELRGTLLEVRPGDKVVLRIPSGQIATIRWDVIARIEQAQAPSASTDPSQPPPLPAPQAGSPPAAGAVPPVNGPDEMDYDSEHRIPAGYHVEKKARLGLLITGASLTGVGLIGVVAIESGKGEFKDFGAVLWGLLFLAPGIPLLIVGLASKKTYLKKDGAFEMWKPPVDVGFRMDPSRGGATLTLGKAF